METTKLQILSTRPLSKELIARAAVNNIFIEEISFIETAIIENETIRMNVENYLQQNITVIFTSMNAVNAVAKFIKSKPNWSIYCIGNTTKKLVQDYFGSNSIAGTATNAAELGEAINKNLKQAVFFCGNQRRDDLPARLKEKNILVDELVVYNTIETPVRLNKKYNGILFFSPSAANSFFSVNKVDNKTQLFAIGKTTAAAIQQYSQNNVIVSHSPGKEEMVKRMVEHWRMGNGEL
jgi:uroporphyrinogen-III synthase